MVLDYAINILASVTLLCLGYCIGRVRLYYNTLSFRQMWKPFIHAEQLSIILSTRPGPHDRSTPRVSLLEMLSFANISSCLSTIGIKILPKDSNVQVGEIKNDNLVVLGGPLANEISKEIWTNISIDIPFSLDTEKQLFRMANEEYVPEIEADGKLIKDYGIIIRQPQPFNSDLSLIYCLGCHGFATYGLTLYLTEKKYAKDLGAVVGDKDNFVALIEFEIQNNLISTSKILHCFIVVPT